MRKSQYEDYYQPQGYYGSIIGARTNNDFLRHQKWYFNWLKYIESKINLEPYRTKKVIDLGGGIGAFCALLGQAGFQDITCSDISTEALKLAKKFNPKLRIAHFDIEKWKAHSAYNLIFAFEVLEHLKKPKAAIKKIYQALKKHGLFIGTTPYPFPKALADPTHCHIWPPKIWQQVFDAAGFARVKTSPMSFPPLLYRLHPRFSFCLPFYLKHPSFVSTTLIIAHKNGQT